VFSLSKIINETKMPTKIALLLCSNKKLANPVLAKRGPTFYLRGRGHSGRGSHIMDAVSI
jgi:hypothetical protein